MTERPSPTDALSTLEKRLDALAADRPTLPEDPRIEALERRLDAALATIEALQDRVAESPSPQSSSAGQVIILDSRLDELEEQDADQVARVAQLEAQVERMQRELDAVGPRLEALDTLRGDLDELRARFDASDGVSALEERLARLESLPPAAADASLTAVKGIGPKYAQALSAAGIVDISTLAELEDPALETLAHSVGVPEKKVIAWRESARAM